MRRNGKIWIEIPGLIENDIRASIGALEDLREKVEENEYKHFQIFGICFPISLGKRELEEIANDLDRFADFMNRLQSMNVYYSAPKVYDVRGRLTGIYFTDANLPTVFPTEPYIVMNPGGRNRGMVCYVERPEDYTVSGFYWIHP